ncbi:MAG: alpha-L-glutamate ligase-like protein [Gammaproteobacteria bacterium]|nr:MAG: alpha-L-glutamate ligase-like protein [Gammaproteobacteria bacterium]
MKAWIEPGRLRARGILGMNRRNIGYIARYNSRDRFPLVDDKLKTKLIAQKANLPVPELLNVVSTQYEIESIEQELVKHTEFVIKPAQGSGGKGILVIEALMEDGFVKSNGVTIELNIIKRHLSNILSGLHSLGGRADVAIVESLVRISPLFEHISHEGVPDIRLIVFKGYPVMGMLRLATKSSDGKANLHQGAVGVGIDIGTGESIAAVQYNRIVKVHPDTGVPLRDIVIPNWQQLLSLAARCYEVTQLGYLGCDIVIDEHKGPLLLELNARPGLSIQIANNQGLLPRLRHVENLEEFSPSVSDRVTYAMRTFTRSRETAPSGETP